MLKQGNWWLQALVHYSEDGEVLLGHRVTGEIRLNERTPQVRCGSHTLLRPFLPVPSPWSSLTASIREHTLLRCRGAVPFGRT